MRMFCNNCGNEIEIIEKAGFRDTCPSCDAWLHSCVHCSFWSGSTCTETSAEPVSDPEGQNFCEWYQEKAQDAGRRVQEDQGRAEAEELWKKLTKK